MIVMDLIQALLHYRRGEEVRATTPHGSFVFKITKVTGTGYAGPVLHLEEVVE